MQAQIESAVPNPTVPPRLVTDFSNRANGSTGFLSAEEVRSLENKLVAYDDSTSNQIAVVIVDDLHGYPIDDYAIALGRKWGVGGQKKISNGVVILVNTGAKGGQRGVFIATGYGLEGAVPDIVTSEIVQNNLLPNFRAGNNFRGLDEATDNIIAAAAGRYQAPKGYHQRGEEDGWGMWIIIVVIVIFILLAIISRKGGGGGYASRRGYTGNWGNRRSSAPWIIPGSGWGSGGGWSSGGGGGGGFGGFGGGSFGGGGAGGSW